MTLTPGGATGELKMVEPCPHDISEQDVALQADGLCPLCLLSKLEAYRKALEEILAAEKEFREGMPPGWEGDPLTDACEAARKVLAAGARP